MLVMPSVAVKVDNQMSRGESEEKESGARHTLEDTPRSQFKRIVEEWESRQVADAPRTLRSLSPVQKSLDHGGKEPPAAGNSIKLDPRESSPPMVKDGSLRRPVDWSGWEEKRTASAAINTIPLDPPRGSANELSFSTLCRDGDAAQGTRVISTSTSRDDEGKWDLEMAIAIGLANRTIHTEAQQEAAALRALRSRAPAGPLEDDLFELSGNQLNLSNGDQFSFSLPRVPEKILPSSPKFGATSPPRRSWERDTAAAAAAEADNPKVGAAGLDSIIQKLKASKIVSKLPQPPPATNQLSGREEIIGSSTPAPVKQVVAPDILDPPTVDLEADRPRPDAPSSLSQIPPLRPKRSSKWSDMPWEDDPLSEGRRRVPDSAARWARAAARRTGPIFHGVDSLEDVKRKLREAYQPQASAAGTTTASTKPSNNNNNSNNNGKQPSFSNHASSIGRSLPTEPLQNKAGTLVAATSDVETTEHRRSLQAAPDPEREEQRRSLQAASDQETGGQRRRSLQALAAVPVQVVAARRPGEMQVPVIDSNKRVAALADINGQPRQVSDAGVGSHSVGSSLAHGSETGIRAPPLKTQHPSLQRSASAGSRSAHGVHRGPDRSEEQEGHHRNRSPRKDQRKNRSHEEVSAAKGEAAKSGGGGKGRHVRSSANMLYSDEMSHGGGEGDTKWRTVEAAMDAAVVVGRGYVERRGKVEGRPLRGVSPFRKARMASGSEEMQKGYMSGSSSLGSDSRKAGMSTGSESSLPTRNGWYIHENAVVMTLDEAIKHGIVVSMVPSSLANTDSSSGGQTSYGSATPQRRKDVPQLQHPPAGNIDVARNHQKASPPREGRTVTFDTDDSKEMKRTKSMNDRNRKGMATNNYITPHAEDVQQRGSMPSHRRSWLQCLNPLCTRLPLTLMDLSDDEDTTSTTSAGTGGTGVSRDRRRSLERDSSRGSEPGAHHRQRSLNWRMHGRKASE